MIWLISILPVRKKRKKNKNKGPPPPKEFIPDKSLPEDTTIPPEESIDSNGDYSYDVLIDRFYDMFYRDYPDRKTGKRYTIPPPKVFRHGGRAIIWPNFPSICQSMNRDKNHVKTFFLKELSTSGSLDIQSRFMIKGKVFGN